MHGITLNCTRTQTSSHSKMGSAECGHGPTKAMLDESSSIWSRHPSDETRLATLTLKETVAAGRSAMLWLPSKGEPYGCFHNQSHSPQALKAAESQFAEVRLLLHPATRFLEGRPVHRPLHAKLLLVSFSVRESRETLVLIGSANMSRRATLLKTGPQQGNVELSIAFGLKGKFTVADFVPELVYAAVLAP